MIWFFCKSYLKTHFFSLRTIPELGKARFSSQRSLCLSPFLVLPQRVTKQIGSTTSEHNPYVYKRSGARAQLPNCLRLLLSWYVICSTLDQRWFDFRFGVRGWDFFVIYRKSYCFDRRFTSINLDTIYRTPHLALTDWRNTSTTAHCGKDGWPAVYNPFFSLCQSASWVYQVSGKNRKAMYSITRIKGSYQKPDCWCPPSCETKLWL